MSSSRVLLLPQSNVLGHLTRTFALAEQLLEQNMDVHIATDVHYSALTKALPGGIIKHQTTELPLASTRNFQPINSYKTGKKCDLTNLENNTRNLKELQLRSRYLKKMIAEDKELITKIKPDIIVTDYRFTVNHIPSFSSDRVFHIANILGYPSFYKRVKGNYFSPLDKGNVLVPGIQEIEKINSNEIRDHSKTHWCGCFRWKGWQRLYHDLSPIPEADIFLCFGSTGNSSVIIPWLLKTIANHYNILMVSDKEEQRLSQKNLHKVKFGFIEQFLIKSKIACCHGGHGTVMECILQETPMLIFPINIEQLEIGKQVEALGLGILMKQPFNTIDSDSLNITINRLLTDVSIRRNLKYYSRQLKKQEGPKMAASVILNKI